MVSVICHNEALRLSRVFIRLQMVIVDYLQDLRSLAAWGRTHIKNRMMGFNIAQNRRHHADNLLPGEQPGIFRIVDNLVNYF